MSKDKKNEDMKEMIFPSYLPFPLKSRTYEIRGYIGDVDEYIDNKGYIDRATSKIYICSNKEPPVHDDVPIMKVINDKHFELIDVKAPAIQKYFTLENNQLYDLEYSTIIQNSNVDDVLYDEEALTDMNASTNKYVPIINEYDDPLKKIIKRAIIVKDIDINRLKHKLPQKYGLTNLKSGLVNRTKMSITVFNLWCELLGLTYVVLLTDNGTDTMTPMKKDIEYDSSTNRITEI